MKKCLSIVLSVLLLLLSVPMVSAESVQSDAPYFTASVVEGKVGDTIVVEILAKNNPGIISAKVLVGYDTAVLKLVDYAAGDFSAGEFGDDASGYSWGSITENPFVINWCNSVEPNSTKELLATLTFEILDDAAYGSSAIDLTVNCEADVFDYDLVTVEFDVVDSEVYVLYPVTGITLSDSFCEVGTGSTVALSATPVADGKTDSTVVWESSDPSVATVDANGVVTAIKKGTATITATAVYGNKSASCRVEVYCSHSNTTVVPAKESTCTEQGNESYTVCNDCGWVDGSDAKLPLAKHTYESQVTKQPTCETAGVRTYTCSACGDTYTEDIAANGHDYKTVVTDPTCETTGYTTYTCACGDSYKADYVNALGHKAETIPGKESTCTETGLTDGSKCSVCGKTLQAQQTTPVKEHKAETIPGKAATCEDTGLTDGSKCSVCGKTLKAQETIAALGHKEETIPGKAATCEETGLTDGAKCSVCGKTLKAQETIAALGHKEETIPGKAATCGETGLTDGTKCSVCGDILKAQETIAATGEHTYDNDKDADCNVCGEKREVQTSTPGDINDDGKINNRDLGILQQFLNEWDVTINEDAADVNDDGKINNRDQGLLQQYLNEWDVVLK